jgi:hypothetical protein
MSYCHCDLCNYYADDVDPDEQEQTVETVKYVIARKARKVGTPSEIRPGDRVRVTSGFTYEPNGPRTGYFRHYRMVGRGPAWEN